MGIGAIQVTLRVVRYNTPMCCFFAYIRRYATYANVMSTICVFAVVVGGGTAVAATMIDGRSLKSESVTGAKIKNGSLGALDLSAAARRTLTGSRGPAGAKGDAGDRGPTGPAGAGAVTSVHDLEGKTCTRPGGTVGAVQVAVSAVDGGPITLACSSAPVVPDVFEDNDTRLTAYVVPEVGVGGWQPHNGTNWKLTSLGATMTYDMGDADWYAVPMDCGQIKGIYEYSHGLWAWSDTGAGLDSGQTSEYCVGRTGMRTLYFNFANGSNLHSYDIAIFASRK